LKYSNKELQKIAKEVTKTRFQREPDFLPRLYALSNHSGIKPGECMERIYHMAEHGSWPEEQDE